MSTNGGARAVDLSNSVFEEIDDSTVIQHGANYVNVNDY